MAFPNNSTGVWTGIMFGEQGNFCSGKSTDVVISNSDKQILRGLAAKKAELADQRIQKEKRELWYKHNSLQYTRPLVLVDPENGWNEIITEGDLCCEGNLAKRWEVVLRKEIFWGELIKDDRPTESNFEIGYTYSESDWGVPEKFFGGKEGGAYKWEPPVKTLDDIDKLHTPLIDVDYCTTERTFELAQDVFQGLLNIKLRGVWWWSFGLTAQLVVLIGLENMMIGMYDNPELIHGVMSKLSTGNIEKLNYLQENELLSLNNDDAYIASGGIGYSKELPGDEFNGEYVKTEHLWGFSESQETCEISPMMFEEFIYPYQVPILELFGLNCYGCCEAIDNRWDVIRNIPRLRRLSVSAWADKAKMAELLGDKYIYSMKPNPADLAVPKIDQNKIRGDIKEYLDVTRGCLLEIIMKDNHTIGRNPNNLTNWVRIVREEIDNLYGP